MAGVVNTGSFPKGLWEGVKELVGFSSGLCAAVLADDVSEREQYEKLRRVCASCGPGNRTPEARRAACVVRYDATGLHNSRHECSLRLGYHHHPRRAEG